jgi:hypothetical protein
MKNKEKKLLHIHLFSFFNQQRWVKMYRHSFGKSNTIQKGSIKSQHKSQMLFENTI